MNDTHKGHKIIVSTSRLAATRWEPRLTVIWSEDSEGKLSKLTIKRAFRVRREAEMKVLYSQRNGSMMENRICHPTPRPMNVSAQRRGASSLKETCRVPQ
jgi:hypothetical protein